MNYKLIFGKASRAKDFHWSYLQERPQTGSNFTEVKNMYHHRDLNPGLWYTVLVLGQLSGFSRSPNLG